MSRIDSAVLNMQLRSGVTSSGQVNVKVFASNYNVLRIMSGMGTNLSVLRINSRLILSAVKGLPITVGRLSGSSLNLQRVNGVIDWTRLAIGLYNRLVLLPKARQHLQTAGTSLEPLLPRVQAKAVPGHGNTVGYGNNAMDWTIRSQAPKVLRHGPWGRFREQTEMGIEALTKPMKSIRCAPIPCESMGSVRGSLTRTDITKHMLYLLEKLQPKLKYVPLQKSIILEVHVTWLSNDVLHFLPCVAFDTAIHVPFAMSNPARARLS